MADQFDMSGMSEQEAKQYVLQYLKALQEVRRQKKDKQGDFETWEKRVRLAKEQGRDDLQQEALARCRQLADEYDSLSQQEKSLEEDVDALKRRLATFTERSVNAEALLGQLEGVVGDSHETDRAVDELEVEADLERLKRQMAAEEGSDDNDGSDGEEDAGE